MSPRGRPKKKIEEVAKEIEASTTEAKTEIELTSQEVADLVKENQKYSEKVQISTEIEDIKQKKELIRKELDNLSNEFNHKHQQVMFLQKEIESKHLEVARVADLVAKEKAKELQVIARKLQQVTEDAAAYEKILKEVIEKERKLNVTLDEFEKKSKFFDSELKRMERQMRDVESAANDKFNEAQSAIDALKGEKEEFEAYKRSLEPEFDRITQLKGENAALLTKIQSEKDMVERERNAVDFEKSKLKSELESERSKLKVLETALLNREAQLKEHEQNLKDLRLELDVKEKRMQQMLKRSNLEDEAKEIGRSVA